MILLSLVGVAGSHRALTETLAALAGRVQRGRVPGFALGQGRFHFASGGKDPRVRKDDLLAQGFALAQSAGRGRVAQALHGAFTDTPDKYGDQLTLALGKGSDIGGEVTEYVVTFAQLCAEVEHDAARVAGCEKTALPLYTASAPRFGGHTTLDPLRMDCLFLDVDGTGPIDGLVRLLDEAGIHYCAVESSGSTATKEKWHIFVPIKPVPVPEASGADLDAVLSEWRETVWKRAYLLTAGALQAASETMTGPFDPRMSTPMQPFFIGTRLTEECPPRKFAHTGQVDGAVLDVLAFAEALAGDALPQPARSVRREKFEGVPRESVLGLALNYLAGCKGRADGDGRDDNAFQVLTTVVTGYDLTFDEFIEHAHRWNQANNDPPMPERKIIDKVKRAATRVTPPEYARGYLIEESMRRVLKKNGMSDAEIDTRLEQIRQQAPASAAGDTTAGAAGDATAQEPPPFSDGFAPDEDPGTPTVEPSTLHQLWERTPLNEVHLTVVVADLLKNIIHAAPQREMYQRIIWLLSHDPTMYQRNGKLVYVTPVPGGGIAIKDHTFGSLYSAMAQHIVFVTNESDKKRTNAVIVEPPSRVVTAVLSRGPWPGIRDIAATAHVPVLTPTGQLVTSGYDVETRVFVDGAASLPERGTTREDADAAVDRIWEMVREFPWVDASQDFCGWLAFLLTACCRHAVVGGAVPIFALIANQAGTGKSHLGDLIGRIAYGRPAVFQEWKKAREEHGKTLTTHRKAGSPLVIFDNAKANERIESSALCSVATGHVTADRLLGTDDLFTAENRTIFGFTGNKIVFGRDEEDRIVRCEIDYGLSSPRSDREFAIQNVLSEALVRRHELLADAISIVRAFILAGRPGSEDVTMGSFEAWSQTILGAIKWVRPDMDLRRNKVSDEEQEGIALALALERACQDARQRSLSLRAALTSDAVTAWLREYREDVDVRTLAHALRQYAGQPLRGPDGNDRVIERAGDIWTCRRDGTESLQRLVSAWHSIWGTSPQSPTTAWAALPDDVKAAAGVSSVISLGRFLSARGSRAVEVVGVGWFVFRPGKRAASHTWCLEPSLKHTL